MARKLLIVVLASLCLSISCAFAQDKHHGFSAGMFKDKDGNTLPYRLFVPNVLEKGKQYPLVLWMHGGAGRGSDNLRQISGGNRFGSSVWTAPENQAKNPAFVLAAQMPRDGRRSRDGSLSKRIRNLKNIVKIIESLKKEHQIDPDRIYVTGQSFGGYGSWWMIGNNPGMFAAAVPVCGWGDPKKASNMKNVAIWAFHGAKDQTIPAERSREIVKAIKEVGGNPKYTEYDDLGHSIWNRVYSKQDLVEWMFKQRRSQNR